MEKIRWGILSTGSIARSFARDLSLIPDAEITAVGSRTQSSADEFANEYNIPNRHASYEALAADPHEQSSGTNHAGDSSPRARGGRLPGWTFRVDVGGGPVAAYRRHALGRKTLPRHGPA